jgi:A/G-specific adenine glycosylase
MDKIKIQHLQTSLLSYYQAQARDLPWRINQDPYRIWVSEIMLQQTQVKTVIPYYERFLSVLPSVSTLADANEELILKLWEGLGYYSRVKNMQKAAKIIMSDYQGVIPNKAKTLVKLPGIGAYTAGAIASIAFGEIVPAIDGNVHRVLSRYFGLKVTKEELTPMMDQLLPSERIGDFNQALMEVGALLCSPKSSPDCINCPLKDYCFASLNQLTDEFPLKKDKLKRSAEYYTLIIITDGEHFYLKQRPSSGILSNLWEFPMFLEKTPDVFLHLQALNLHPEKIEQLPKSTHSFTHKDWIISAYYVKVNALIPRKEYLIVSKTEISSIYSLSSLKKKYQEYYL